MANGTIQQCLFSTLHSSNHEIGIQITAIATTVIGIISSIGSILGNALVLFVLFKHERLRTPSNVLLGSLCLTDFLTGFIVVPTVSIRRITEAYGSGICIIRIVCAYFSYLTVIVSVVTIGLISIDRYYAIMMPFRYQRKISTTKYFILLAIVWLLLAMYSSLPFLNIISGSKFFIIACSFLAVNIVIFVICYIKISKVVNSHKAKLHRRRNISAVSPEVMKNSSFLSRRSRLFSTRTLDSDQSQSPYQMSERQKTNTVVMVVVTTIFCYGPLMIIYTLRGIMGDTFELVYIADPWADLIMYFNSTLNPVIYCLRAKDIRDAALRILPVKISKVFQLD